MAAFTDEAAEMQSIHNMLRSQGQSKTGPRPCIVSTHLSRHGRLQLGNI